jgi:uncharacterized membrane protein affecting hemolysin expression
MKKGSGQASSKLFGKHSSRFDIVFVCLVVLVVGMMGMVWQNYRSNTDTIFALTEDLITQVNATVTQKTSHYLVAAPIMNELASRITGEQVDNLTASRALDQVMIAVL